ncbi:MAG: hypothetical protein V9G12_03810 [Microthrixaceae bacterium]|jgi:WD40 repeat protein
MRFKRSVRTALVTAAALVAGACGPAPSNPEPLPWSQFTLGAGVTQGNAHATAGATSADGSVQAFISGASNLVPGDTNNTADVFVRANGTTTRIAEGVSGPVFISADGRFVSFSQNALVFDRQTSTLIDLGVTAVGVEGTAWVSSSGTEAVFGIGDSLFGPSAASCWIRPLDLGPATSCNPDPTVATGLLAASADLNRILVQIFPTNTARYLALVDRAAGTITPLTGISAPIGSAAISPNGRYIAWPEVASLVNPFPSTVSVYDTQTLTVSAFTPPADPNGLVQPIAIANDGHTVLAWSYATNLVSGDTNAVVDVFRIDVTAATAVRVSRTESGAQLAHPSFTALHPSAVDGTFTRVALCASEALSTIDTNGQSDCTLVPI